MGSVAEQGGEAVSSPATVKAETKQPELRTSELKIAPPAYTGRASWQTSEREVKLAEGSSVHWRMTFSEPHFAYRLVDSAGERVALVPDVGRSAGLFSAETRAVQSGIYRLEFFQSDHWQPLAPLFTLQLKRDLPPKLKWLAPRQTLLEFTPKERPHFSSEILIKDDYGLSTAKIYASVAKGSGEAVKFRDLRMDFDGVKNRPQGKVYANSGI